MSIEYRKFNWRSKNVGEPLDPAALVYGDRYQQLADRILNDPSYNEVDILICWHHGKLMELAHALGVRPHSLPKHACWPNRWSNHVFGWILQLRFDPGGLIISDKTTCFNQKLMHGDHGWDPPSG